MRSNFHCTVLRAGLDTLETRVTESERGKETFFQGWNDRPFDNAAPSVEGILHAMSKQKEFLRVLPFTSLWNCNLYSVES